MAARQAFAYRVFANSSGSVAVLEGELDVATASKLKVAGSSLLACGRSLTLDLRALTFIDAAALRVLVYLQGRAQREGTTLSILASACGPVDRLFDLCRMHEQLDVRVAPQQDRSAAMTALAA